MTRAVDGPTTGPVQIVERIVYRDRPTPAPAAADPLLATLGREGAVVEIHLSDIQQALFEGHSLDESLYAAQLKLSESEAAQRHLPLATPAEIPAEVDRTMAKMAEGAIGNPGGAPPDKADYPKLLEQILGQRHISRAEFDMAMLTNINARRICETIRPAISEENLQRAYNIEYGETAQVEHIQCSNMSEISAAQELMKSGKSFEDAARQVSRNRITAPLGGSCPPSPAPRSMSPTCSRTPRST